MDSGAHIFPRQPDHSIRLQPTSYLSATSSQMPYSSLYGRKCNRSPDYARRHLPTQFIVPLLPPNPSRLAAPHRLSQCPKNENVGVPPRYAFPLALLRKKLAQGRACPGLASRSVLRVLLRYTRHLRAPPLYDGARIQPPPSDWLLRSPPLPSLTQLPVMAFLPCRHLQNKKWVSACLQEHTTILAEAQLIPIPVPCAEAQGN